MATTKKKRSKPATPRTPKPSTPAPVYPAGVLSLPVVPFVDAAAWSRWLAKHHADSPGIRMKVAKLGAGIRSITCPEAIEVALCWGWIDGRRNRLDDAFYLQQFSPRRARSPWSKINRDKVAALIEAGRMMPPGLAEIERAKADGRWERAYDPPSKVEVPADLVAALAKNRRAREHFAALDSRNRYAVLWRIHQAKRAETRARRIADFVAMLARGERLYP